MAAVTAASTRTESMGSLTLYIFTIASADDDDTFDTNLGERVVTFWHQQTDDPSTQASAGLAASESAGTITFFPGEDGAAVTVFVLATGV